MNNLFEECKTEKSKIARSLVLCREENSEMESSSSKACEKLRLQVRIMEEKLLQCESDSKRVMMEHEIRNQQVRQDCNRAIKIQEAICSDLQENLLQVNSQKDQIQTTLDTTRQELDSIKMEISRVNSKLHKKEEILISTEQQLMDFKQQRDDLWEKVDQEEKRVKVLLDKIKYQEEKIGR